MHETAQIYMSNIQNMTKYAKKCANKYDKNYAKNNMQYMSNEENITKCN